MNEIIGIVWFWPAFILLGVFFSVIGVLVYRAFKPHDNPYEKYKPVPRTIVHPTKSSRSEMREDQTRSRHVDTKEDDPMLDDLPTESSKNAWIPWHDKR